MQASISFLAVSIVFLSLLSQRQLIGQDAVETIDTIFRSNDSERLSLRNLEKRSSQAGAYDGGLGADWLLSLWLHDNGLSTDATTKYFAARAQSKAGFALPDWWLCRLRREFDLETDIDTGRQTAPPELRASFDTTASVRWGGTRFRVPKVIRSDSNVFIGSNNSRYCLIVVDRKSVELSLYVMDSITHELDHKVDVLNWCPILYRQFDSFKSSITRPFDIAIRVEDNLCLIVGDLENRLFLSIYDVQSKLPVLCFETMPDAYGLLPGYTIHEVVNEFKNSGVY